MARVNPPKQLVLPQEVSSNLPLKKAFDDLNFIVFQLEQFSKTVRDETTTVTTSDVTAVNGQNIVCNNTVLTTVTLPASPEDNATIIVKRMNTGDVDITSTVNIDGLTTQTLSTIYDSMTVKYISDLAVWIII